MSLLHKPQLEARCGCVETRLRDDQRILLLQAVRVMWLRGEANPEQREELLEVARLIEGRDTAVIVRRIDL